jgi:hypothetical protein
VGRLESSRCRSRQIAHRSWYARSTRCRNVC